MNELIDFSACPLSSRNLQYGGRLAKNAESFTRENRGF